MTDLTTYQDFRTDKQKSAKTEVDYSSFRSFKFKKIPIEVVPAQPLEDIHIIDIEVSPSVITESIIEDAVYEEIKPEIQSVGSEVLNIGAQRVTTHNESQALIPFDKEQQLEEFKQSGFIPHRFAKVLRPFQVAGVLYAMDKKRTFIADEMGLGKSIQALVTVESLGAYPCLIICPNSLKYNWKNEIIKWLPENSYHVFTSSNILALGLGLNKFKDLQFYIINYELLKNGEEALLKIPFKAMIIDESHYLKTEEAQRTKFVSKLSKGIENIFMLTGTPVLNRPTELLSQLKIMRRLEDLGGEHNFMNSFFERGYGGKFTTAKHLDALNDRLRATCYIRRSKSIVLKELPLKQRTIVPTDIDNRDEYNIAETSLVYYLKTESNKFGTLDGFLDGSKERFMANALVRIEVLKQLTARGKLKSVIEWVQDFLETDEKLIIYAHHIEIQRAIFNWFEQNKSEEFYPTSLFSDQDPLQRQANVDKFQTDDKCKLMVASLDVGGVGYNMTAASNVAFIELGWNPSKHEQAEDRVHRIGQTDSVMAYYFIGNNTIDEWIYDLIERKRVVVNATHDGIDAGKQMSILSDLISRLRRK